MPRMPAPLLVAAAPGAAEAAGPRADAPMLLPRPWLLATPAGSSIIVVVFMKVLEP